VLICTNKDAKLLTTAHDLDCAKSTNKQELFTTTCSKPQYSKKCFIKRQNRGASEYETKSDRTKSFESLMIRIEKKKNQQQAASEIKQNKG